jgi:hypothetical protein
MFEIDNTPKPINGYKMSTPNIMIGKNNNAKVSKGSIILK